MFYVYEGQIPSAMPRSKCSYQRIAYRSHLIYTNERKECLLTHTKERMVSAPTDKLIIPRIFRFVSTFCKNFQKNFFKEKDNSDFTELPFLKSLASFVIYPYFYCVCKNHTTTYYYINIFKILRQFLRCQKTAEFWLPLGIFIHSTDQSCLLNYTMSIYQHIYYKI